MIIDQLSPTVSDNLTDEIPVEQGELTFKTTWQKILNLFSSNMDLSNFLKLDGTSINYWAVNTKDLNDVNTGIVLCKNNVLHTPPIIYAGTNEYWLVVSTGSDNTTMQIAFPAFGTNSNEKIVPMIRYRQSGSWSSWKVLTYVDKTGDTMTGRLDMSGANVRFKSTNITDGIAVGSGTEGNSKFEFRDNDNNLIGQVYPFFDSNGDQSLIIYTQRKIGNTDYTNYITLGIDSSGNFKVSVPNDPWRRRLRVPQIANISINSGSLNGNVDGSFTHNYASDISCSEILAVVPYGGVPSASWNTSLLIKNCPINGKTVTFQYHTVGSNAQSYTLQTLVYYLP